MKSNWVYYGLVLLTIEKIVQHIFVTLAFYYNWSDIASTVVVSPTLLMVLGAIVAALFGPTLAVRSWLVFDGGVIVPLTGPQPHAVYFGVVWNLGRAWRSDDRRPRAGAGLRRADFHEKLRRRSGSDGDQPLVLPAQQH